MIILFNVKSFAYTYSPCSRIIRIGIPEWSWNEKYLGWVTRMGSWMRNIRVGLLENGTGMRNIRFVLYQKGLR